MPVRTLSNNLRLFWQGTLLSYVALFHWLRPGQYLASKLLMPLAQMFFFVLLGTFGSGSDNASFYIIGNAIQITAVNGIFGVTMSVGGEREAGTLPYLFGTPANRMVIFFGRAFMHILDGMFGVVIAFGWGVFLFDLDLSHTDLGALMLTIAVTTISTCGLGLLLGCLSLITVNVMFVNNFVYFVLLIFSGANVPIAELPGWMQIISYALPLTRGIAAGRSLVAGFSLAQVAPLLWAELGIGLMYGIIGYLLFAIVEVEAKRRGTLEVF
jgi:ABC-2 type transport system permease protein